MTTTRQPPGELGRRLSTHEVDNERRRRIGGWGLTLGVAAGVLSAIMWPRNEISSSGPPGQGQLVAGVIGLAIGALAIGVTYLWRGLRGGSREYFEVHEAGLSYAIRGRIRTYPWDHIAHVRIRKWPTADPIRHYFGGHYRATISFTNRRGRLVFNGLTSNYRDLGAALLANCAPAPPISNRQRLTWLAAAAACVAVFVFLVRYIATHPDTERSIDHDTYTETVNVPGMSETTIYLIVAGLVITAVLALAAAIMAFRKG